MTPDDCEVRRTSRTFDINVFDDEEAEESLEVGADDECDEDPMWDVENCDRFDIHKDQAIVEDEQETKPLVETTAEAHVNHAGQSTKISPTKLVTRKAAISKVDYWKRQDSGKEVRDYWNENACPELPTPCQSTPPSLTACQAPRAPSSRKENMNNSKSRDADGFEDHDTGKAETTQIEPPPRNSLRRAGFKESENPMREYWRRKDSGEQMW